MLRLELRRQRADRGDGCWSGMTAKNSRSVFFGGGSKVE
jgi:hypothetical protein